LARSLPRLPWRAAARGKGESERIVSSVVISFVVHRSLARTVCIKRTARLPSISAAMLGLAAIAHGSRRIVA
jgi:hypothetical protein